MDKETVKRANEIFAEVLADIGGGGDYRMRLKLHRIGFGGNKDSDEANAFALPDGLIVAGDRLLKILSDEEFAAVMAHEIGHVHGRHGMRSFLQSVGLFAFISFAFGDPSFLLAGGVGLLNLKYSRGFEREADCFAYHYTVRNNLPATLIGDALQKMELAMQSNPVVGDIAKKKMSSTLSAMKMMTKSRVNLKHGNMSWMYCPPIRPPKRVLI